MSHFTAGLERGVLKNDTPVHVYRGELANLFLNGGAIAQCVTKGSRLAPRYDLEGSDWFRHWTARACRALARDRNTAVQAILVPYREVKEYMGKTLLESLEAQGKLD